MADTQVKNETELTSVDGDEVLYIVDDPAGTPADRKIKHDTIVSGYGAAPIPYEGTGGTNGMYLGPPAGVAITGAAVTANRLYMMPFFVPHRRTFTDVLLSVASAVAGNCRLGIYRRRANSGMPGTLIADFGTVSVNVTNTDQRITISQALAPGWYLAASVSDVAMNVRRLSGSNSIGGAWVPSGSTVTNVTGLSRAFTYGALPADETASAYANDTPPAVFLK